MPTAAVLRRGTGMVDSDVRELVTQHNLAHTHWVLSCTIAINSTQFSGSGVRYLRDGDLTLVADFATGGGFTGITAATGNVVVVAAYITTSGTHIVAAGATAGSFGVAAMPTVPSTAIQYGLILIKASGTSGFTGGTTALDGTNASAVFISMVGPTGIAINTGPMTVVPG